jgi:hypothetical protein
MIVKPLNSVYPQERELPGGKDVSSTTVDQTVQEDHQTLPEVPTKKKMAQPRMSVDEVMTFWSCMVPYGWSLGGLLAFLLHRKRKKTGRAIISIIFGLLSALCYLVAVLQAGAQRPPQREVYDPMKAKGHPGE